MKFFSSESVTSTHLSFFVHAGFGLAFQQALIPSTSDVITASSTIRWKICLGSVVWTSFGGEVDFCWDEFSSSLLKDSISSSIFGSVKRLCAENSSLLILQESLETSRMFLVSRSQSLLLKGFSLEIWLLLFSAFSYQSSSGTGFDAKSLNSSTFWTSVWTIESFGILFRLPKEER